MAEPILARGLRGVLKCGEPMSRHVSWRAGGAAQRAYFPADLDDLAAFLRALPADEPVHFVGLGSNLLVRDGGLRGTVVFTHGALKAVILAEGEARVVAQAGVASPKVARLAAMHDLEGAEFLAGIPGTVGGALAMNAGCFGGETWDIVESVRTVDRSGALRTRTPADYRIAYRSVVPLVPAPGGEWFVEARFRLLPGNGARSRQAIRDYLARRIATQPLGEPNAGSVFRNPPGDHAARLIEACGLKGRRIGGAVVSPRHANFIVNSGGASAADIEALIELVRAQVAQRFGVLLEREVHIVGDPAAEARA